MTEPIKLTENNIHITSYVYGHFVQIEFRLDEKEKAKQLKQQILENQEKAELYNPRFKEFYDNWHYILQENKRLKEKLEKVV